MSAPVIADNVPHEIKVRAGDGPGDSARCRKEPCHGDLRKRRRPLEREFRAKITQGRARQVYSSSYVARITEPQLVRQVGSGRPSITQVHVLLPPSELLHVPGDVAVGLAGGGIQRRNHIVSARVEVASTQALIAGQVVIHLNQKLIRVVRAWGDRLESTAARRADIGKNA